MKNYVTDTHSLLWHILDNGRLSKTAARVFTQAEHNDAHIFIPTIVLIEIVYLIEKARIPDEAINNVIELAEEASANYRLVSIQPSTVRTMRSLPYALIPDMPDRIITATAIDLGLPLITKDRKITEAAVVKIVW